MQTQITSWLRAINRDKTLNILCVPTHEAYETNLTKTGHNFFAIRNQHCKNWDSRYRKIPDNYIVFDNDKPSPNIEFDLIISQNRFGQFQLLAPYSQRFGIPLICIEHTAALPFWDGNVKQQLSNMRGHKNVFISDYSINMWGFNKDDRDVQVIKHAIDTDVFKPNISFNNRKNSILEVANDFCNRDSVLNFSQYMRVTNGLPTERVGDTPGFSLPAKNEEDLVNHYARNRIFINTHHISPIPMSLLEAASCGCAIVTCETCGIPEFFTNGKDALLCKNDKDMRSALEFLLANAKEAERLGLAARQTILEKCTLDRFTSEWNSLFNEVILK